MFQKDLLRECDLEPLVDGVYRVLENVGVLCENAELLEALEARGARVDHAAERAWFPRKMVEDLVEELRKETSRVPELDMYGDERERKSRTRPSRKPYVPSSPPDISTQIAQFSYDYVKGERRPGNREDLVSLLKLGDVLHPDLPAGHALVLREVPPGMEAMEAALVIAEYAHKPAGAFAWYVDQVDYLKEMGDILGLRDWFSWGGVCFAHPFRLDKVVADKFVRRVREGVPTGLTAMPIAGFTTPATVEGFIVVSSAEHVATWLAARAINPQVLLQGSMWAGTVDMSSGHISYSAFDAMYYAFAAVEFLRRWTGVAVAVGGGEYCDAREPGLYAAMEKAHKAMTVAAFTGQHPPIGQGLLEEGKTVAPVQLMVEWDLYDGAWQYARTVDPSEENLAMQAIEEVGLGLATNHLQTRHTLEHFRSCFWLPKVVDRSGWKGVDSDRAMLDKAQARIDELLASYKKPEGRDEQLAEMRKVAERARGRIGTAS